MKILRHPELDEREFGRAAIRVGELRSWAERERLCLPRTTPSVDDFDAVQLEALLSALGAGASDYAGDTTTDAQILDAARAMLNEDEEQGVNPKVREMIEQDRSVQLARWYVGGRVHVHWRRKLEEAVRAGALAVFDALTGLPIAGLSPGARGMSRQTHSTKSEQRDEADVFIDAALATCGLDADGATVWAHLQRLADDKAVTKPGTLIGLDEDGLKYMKNGTVAWMTRDALSKRLKRRRAP